VTLVAVTKNVESERILKAVEAGISDCGENYVQEALAKQSALSGRLPTIRWHFIGHLQRNKARSVVGSFAIIQSVDSLPLASELGERALQSGLEARILLQVKLDTSQTKFGFQIRDTLHTLESARSIPGIQVLGLMGMAPFTENPETVRRCFRDLRALYDTLPPDCRQILSMGMTADFEVAIEEGATMVRIGTAIFGPRSRV
ncbi:MAG TPA: YggS family pyridoxal phosphate-dependent enzyme, partial [Chthonomonadaceae bacterium]|nr:YggS family pyridoxal phosphate-dependent enzyme [Chthonomonadaceae bacterium]